jgi:chaperonin GroES
VGIFLMEHSLTNSSGLRPMEFNVVIRMDPTETRTPGGLYLPPTKTDRDELATDEGTLEAVSPHAFTYADWPEGAAPPKPGDRVLFAQYAGRLWEHGGTKFRLLKDKDIVAIVEPRPALSVAA